jgi:hypothetical protein
MSDSQTSYDIAIKTVADYKQLVEYDKTLKLTIQDVQKLGKAMDELKSKSDAASRAQLQAGQAMMARDSWLKSLPTPNVTYADTKRGTGTIAAEIARTGGGLASSGGVGKSAAELKAEEKAAGIRLERQMAATAAAQKREAALHSARVAAIEASKIAAPAAPAGPGMLGNAAAAYSAQGGGIRGGVAAIGSVAGMGVAATAASMAAVAGVAAAAAKSIHAYAEAEERVVSLDAALASSGQLTDKYRESLQELAGATAKVTGVSSDKWVEVMTKLTQFGATEGTMGKRIEDVKNLAGILGGDLVQAATMVSRAMQGNYQAFSRYGIVVKDAGTETEKFASLSEQLAQRGGGQLEARMQTLTGQFGTAKKAVNELFQSFGQVIARTGILQGALGQVGTVFDFWAKAIGGVIPRIAGLRSSLNVVHPALAAHAAASAAAAEATRTLTANAEAAATALQSQARATQAVHAAEDSAGNAQVALANALVDANERSGHISPQTANIQRANIQANAERDRFMLAQRRDAEEIARTQVESGRRGTLTAGLTAREADLSERYGRAALAQRTRNEASNAAADVRDLERAENMNDPLERALGFQRTPSEELLRRRRRARGLSDVANAVTGPGTTDDDAVQLGRQLARVREQLDENRNLNRPLNDAAAETIGNAQLRMHSRAGDFGVNQTAAAIGAAQYAPPSPSPGARMTPEQSAYEAHQRGILDGQRMLVNIGEMTVTEFNSVRARLRLVESQLRNRPPQ